MIRLFCIFCVALFARVFYRHRVYGKKHFPNGGGIICSNHTSYLDPPLIGISCPGKVHFLGRDSLFHSPFFGWLIRQLNTHPVRRGKGNINAFKKAMALVRNDCKVVIFPEGRRSADGELHKGQLGVGMLVQKTDCQVIPVYLHGVYEVWNNRRRFPKLFGKTACIFGTPLTFEDLEEMDKKEAQVEIMARVMAKIAQLREWYREGAKGTPP
ncbi:MAG: Bifunctional protein Aas [Chlamydiales bacterium]|nr:Bifunctional protein Aas [Chlamydiales bacterium]